MKRITQINVLSVLKISAALGAVAGLVVGVILFVVDLFDKRFLEAFVTLALAPVLYGVMGALVNSLMAWIYNLVAVKLGGIAIQLED